MKTLVCYIKSFYRIAAMCGLGFVAWKIIRHWHSGLAEKTGRTIDASIGAAAQKLEMTAIALEKGADSGLGENLGRGIDEILIDTQKTLEKATHLVENVLKHAH